MFINVWLKCKNEFNRLKSGSKDIVAHFTPNHLFKLHKLISETVRYVCLFVRDIPKTGGCSQYNYGKFGKQV